MESHKTELFVLQHGRGMIPKRKHLPASRQDVFPLWSSIGSLPVGEMSNTLDLQTDLWTKLAQVLDALWDDLSESFKQLRVTTRFLEAAKLERFLPIHATIGTAILASSANSLAASGTRVFPDTDRKQ